MRMAEVFRLVGEDEPAAKGTMMLGEISAGKQKRKIVYEQPEVKETNALKYELQLFLRAIMEKSRPIVDAEDGKRALEVAHAIMERIQQQRLPM